MKKVYFSVSVILFIGLGAIAQFPRFQRQQKLDPVIQKMVEEETNNSQLKVIAHELLDKIGPRLVGTPKMQQANDWAVAKYKSWDIEARNEKWGEWRGWERGITHIDMIAPWVKTLEGTQLAWSPSTKGKTVTADVVVFPDLQDSVAYANWASAVKGKFVLISMMQPTGRSDANWKEFGTENSIAKMNHERDSLTRAWSKRISKSGYNSRTLPEMLEKAGAAGIIINNWSKGFGVDKIFGANTKKIPTVDIALEDYGLIYRLVENGTPVKLNIQADSRETGIQPTFNTVAEIKGSEKPNEYVLLSAHFDSWDGGTGATDNGTGTMVMMEAMRLLKKFYPNPKRTIMVGHWGSEEQGLNGSRAFVEDHPEIVKGLQASFNQDNGTGRIENMSGQGFLNTYEYLQRWLAAAPDSITRDIKTTYPGFPGGGGSDFASFVAAGAPGLSLGSLSWDYGTYTWHTNRDTYDKVVFDDVQKNVILTAALAYMASEDPSFFNREKSVLPVSPFTGQPGKWPTMQSPTRKGGLD
ncbi:MAG: M20/M25/M40 family metallo-hydrolase [Bacteroidetes bacterium]|nr:M20/M25/M40 family metallo-hydrolase [Bacteroidota bacterium]MBS1632042.1 M20/M25/M40 family metallo-hydrolase [Bacteroidota bacterium]